MRKSNIFFMAICIMFIGCKASQNEKSYQSLKKNSTDSNLYSNIYTFELEHPDHFESKLDLAKLNLFSGNYKESWNYLKRAEGIYNNTKHSKINNSDLSAMYGSFATLYLISNDLDQASVYVNKAYEVPKYGELYGYLKGRVAMAQGNKDDAWNCFEKTFKKFPSQITAEELQTYMYLAAERQDYKKALQLLEIYFKKGTFFPGLGLFASGVYEKNGDYQKSVFCAFLDYEYQSCFGNSNEEQFIKNLRNGIVNAEKEGHEDGVKAMKAVLALYTDEKFDVINTDFFAYKYIYYKYKFQHYKWEPKDAQYYLEIENVMSTFPIYYWMLWQVAVGAEIEDYSDWTSILEKIIMLNKSIYTDKARSELGRIEGLTEAEAKKLLISTEVNGLVNSYIATQDESYLDPVYEFISVKDCEHVYSALASLKTYCTQSSLLNDTFNKKALASEGRLKDRLQYIVR